MLRGLGRRYILEHGAECLQVKRKEPLSGDDLRKIKASCAGKMVKGTLVDWAVLPFLSVLAAMAVGLTCAFRKAELFVPNGTDFDFRRLSFGSLTWHIGGVHVPFASEAQLQGLRPGDSAVLRSVPSKADAFNVDFGEQLMWLPVNALDEINAALLLAKLELAMRVAPALRRTTSLFCTNVDGTPVRHREADSFLAALMLLAFGYAKASKHSWHSLRIGCACALKRLSYDDAAIMRYCRWKSPESLRIYARIGRHDFSTAVHRIAGQTIDTLNASNLPRVNVVEAVTRTLWSATVESEIPELDADQLVASVLQAAHAT